MTLEQRVRRYAAEVIGDDATDATTAVVRLAGGDRHTVFKVTRAVASGPPAGLVVRVSTRSDTAERAQVAREAAVLAALAGTAAPRLLDASCDGRWFDAPVMCTEFIAGAHRELATATRPELAALGAVVSSVHARPTADLAERLRPAKTGVGYLVQWSELIDGYRPKLRRPLPPSVGDGVERSLASATRILNGPLRQATAEGGDPLSLLHGDITPGNVLWADRPVLIDWEYARLGDPADDVAYVFGQHGLSADQRSAFWSGYRSLMGERDLDPIAARARLWEPVILLGSALWWLERWSARANADDAGHADPSAPKPAPYYLDQASRRLDRLRLAHGFGDQVGVV
jgi:aminoglycoside phosphotransferase (APT) family kinase protein